MSKIAFHLFVLPLSKLPLWMIYGISNVLYVILRFVVGYRKKVIVGNLTRSFPEKSEREIQKLTAQFYRHFTDILVEGIKNLSISEKELRKRMRVVNPEIMDDLFQKNKSVLLVSGHYNNWEWLISAQNFLFKHQAVGIGIPLTSKFWDKKVNEKRARFGMKIINSRTVRDFFSIKHEKAIATLTLGDQAPGNAEKAYWMTFLNQETPVQFGCEMLANAHEQAVVFFITRKIKRGYYEIELHLITENPKELSWGEITEIQTQLLEKEIVKNPSSWMWSHKRWKRAKPANLVELKVKQEKSFYEKYR